MISSDTSSRVLLVISDDDLSEESERDEDANRRDNIAIQKKNQHTETKKSSTYTPISVFQNF